jgi:hypothetical protein
MNHAMFKSTPLNSTPFFNTKTSCMKKLLLLAFTSWLFVACSNTEKKEDATSTKTDDMTALYEKNLAVVKSAIAAFEKKDIEG